MYWIWTKSCHTDYSFINLENADGMREYCESTCGDQQWDTGLGAYGSPCNSDLWSASFWLADQDHHDDHHDDHYDDHYDDHHDDHHDDNHDSWSYLFADEVIFLFYTD